MTANTTTSTQHDCADHGCLAAMLGVELSDAPAGERRLRSSSGTLLG